MSIQLTGLSINYAPTVPATFTAAQTANCTSQASEIIAIPYPAPTCLTTPATSACSAGILGFSSIETCNSAPYTNITSVNAGVASFTTTQPYLVIGYYSDAACTTSSSYAYILANTCIQTEKSTVESVTLSGSATAGQATYTFGTTCASDSSTLNSKAAFTGCTPIAPYLTTGATPFNPVNIGYTLLNSDYITISAVNFQAGTQFPASSGGSSAPAATTGSTKSDAFSQKVSLVTIVSTGLLVSLFL